MSNTTDGITTNNSTQKQPNKKRYKKLWKRATHIPESIKSDVSGISTPAEWSEFQDLHKHFDSNQSLIGTCVHWRNGKVRECVESADQRDILHRLLMHPPSQNLAGTKRKREKEVEPPNIPSWATLSNPYACEHICVVELHCQKDYQPSSSFASYLRDHLGELSTQHGRHVFSTQVRWFQEDQPLTCVSQAVMYRAQPKQSKENKDHSPTEHNVKDKYDLYKALQLLKLKPSELIKENYPTRQPKSLTQDTDSVQSKEVSKLVNRKPSEIDVECAKKLVDELSVSMKVENDTHHAVPYVASSSFGKQQSRIFAVDCEMVRTTVGLELARITLIEVEEFSLERDLVYKLVWDEIVKPVHPVVDYLTVYSGMTKDIIDHATVSMEQVQAALVATIRNDDILIGHSLENDLRVMQFVHDSVVDTAILFRPSNGRFKYSLRVLAARLLRKQIQKSNSSHCSLEDAATALKLASRRAIDGSSFQMFDAAPINRVQSVASEGNTTVCIGPSEWIHQHITSQANSIHALGCESIKDSNHKAVCSWIAGPSRRARLVWANFDLQHPDDLKRMKQVTSDLLAKMSPGTVITFMLQGGYKEANTLSNLRKARRNPKTTIPWTAEDEEKWIDVMNTARVGTCFWVGTSHTQN